MEKSESNPDLRAAIMEVMENQPRALCFPSPAADSCNFRMGDSDFCDNVSEICAVDKSVEGTKELQVVNSKVAAESRRQIADKTFQ